MDSRIVNHLQQWSKTQSGLSDRLAAADGSLLIADGREYIDFYSGAGTLNYGHRNPVLMRRLLNDIRRKGPLGTGGRTDEIRSSFFHTVDQVLLRPRAWPYQMQLAGPTGACALEAALRLARRTKGRQNIISFTEGFQGASGRALAASARVFFRKVTGQSGLGNITFMPYDRCFGPDVDTMAHLEQLLESTACPSDIPAAVVVETVLGQGGVSVLTWRWLKELEALCQRHDMLLVMDDTQVGCGRTGRFFSFEAAGIQPDMVVLTKSLSGFGLPMSLLLTAPSIDTTKPVAHSMWASALDHDLALLTATHALDVFWIDDSFSDQIQRKESLVRDWLENIVHSYPDAGFGVRGRGLIQGLVMARYEGLASQLATKALESGLLIETAGAYDEVLKLLPALTIENELLIRGLEIIEHSLAEILRQSPVRIRSIRPNTPPDSAT